MESIQNKSGTIFGAFSRIVPFFLPALFFQTALFAFVSPLPLFISTLRNRFLLSLAALFSNLAILTLIKGGNELPLAAFLWCGIGIAFPYLIRKTGKVRFAGAICYLSMVLAILTVIVMLGRQAGFGPIEYVRSEIALGMDHLIQMPDSPVKKIVEEEGRDGVYRQILRELPSGILIGLLLAFWLNLLFASQIVRGFLSRTFWSQYRNPEWLVWPTLGSGALFAFAAHAPYFIGLNLFKLLLVFYAFQGLSVIGHFLNRGGVEGFFRSAIFALGLFLAMPVVISLGFFDLWFDFRRKFGQS